MLQADLQCIENILCGNRCDCSMSDWYSVLGFLEVNRLSGRFYQVVSDQDIALPEQIRKQLKRTAEYQTERNKQLGIWVNELSGALERERIPFAILKGNVMIHADFRAKDGIGYHRALYQLTERTSNDIDLLVSPRDIGKVEKVLVSCGFTQGYYNEISNTIRIMSRREIIERRMNRGETVPYQRLLDCEQLRHVEVDINFSLDYLPNGTEDVLDKMLSNSTLYSTRKGGTVRSLEITDFVIHLLLHQYKEMRVYSMVMRGKDLELYKLLDIYLMLQKVSQADLYKRIEEYGVETQTAVVLKTLTEVFNRTKLSNEFVELINGLDGQAEFVVDPTRKNKPYVWSSDVLERLKRFDYTGMLVETT